MRTDPLLNIPQQSSGAPDKLRRKLIYRQTEDIMGLGTFALNASPYFQYNGKLYKWLDGTASVGVAGFRRCYCCSNSDTKHKGTRYYFPCSTRHSAAWNKGRYHVFTLLFLRSPSPAGYHKNHPSQYTTTCNSVTTQILFTLLNGAFWCYNL